MKYKEKELFERRSSWFKFDEETMNYIEGLLEPDENYKPTAEKRQLEMLFALVLEYRNNGDISEAHKTGLKSSPLMKIAFEHITDCIYEADLAYNHKIESGRKGGLRKKAPNNSAYVPDIPPDLNEPYEI